MKVFVALCLVAAALAAPANPAPTSSCASTQSQLEQGIQQNLDIQAQELKGVEALQSMVQSGNVTATSFKKEQECVLNIQQQGIAVRANNQKLAAAINSPAAAGLATVAQAQVQEMTQVQGLKGTSSDASTLKQLVSEVEGGTAQNQKNLAAAKSQKC